MVKGKLIRCLTKVSYDGCKDRDLDTNCVFFYQATIL